MKGDVVDMLERMKVHTDMDTLFFSLFVGEQQCDANSSSSRHIYLLPNERYVAKVVPCFGDHVSPNQSLTEWILWNDKLHAHEDADLFAATPHLVVLPGPTYRGRPRCYVAGVQERILWSDHGHKISHSEIVPLAARIRERHGVGDLRPDQFIHDRSCNAYKLVDYGTSTRRDLPVPVWYADARKEVRIGEKPQVRIGKERAG